MSMTPHLQPEGGAAHHSMMEAGVGMSPGLTSKKSKRLAGEGASEWFMRSA